MKKYILPALLIGVFALTIGCGGTKGSDVVRGKGDLSIFAIFEDSTRGVPGYADTVRVTVTPPEGVALPGNFPNPFFLTRDSSRFVISDLKASAAPYLLDMDALTDGGVVGTVQRNVFISTNGEIQQIDVSTNLESTIDQIWIEGIDVLELEMFEGDTKFLTAFAVDSEGATLFSGAGFSWTTSNPTDFVIDPDTGKVFASQVGWGTITAHLIGTTQGRTVSLTSAYALKIAFASTRDGNDYEIFVMNSDGTNQVQLTNNDRNDRAPSFSADGSKIAYHSYIDGSDEIYVMNADGTNKVRLTNNEDDNTNPSFSPDGSKITFTRDLEVSLEVYVINADGTNMKRLTNEVDDNFGPSFNSDGTKIGFSSKRNGPIEIYLMDADGDNPVRLTNNVTDDRNPTFSSDGLKIAFTSRRDGNDEIYVMNVDGTNQVRLTNDEELDFGPSFSADGSKIAFTSQRDGNREVYVMNADGTNKVRLTDDGSINVSPSFGGG